MKDKGNTAMTVLTVCLILAAIPGLGMLIFSCILFIIVYYVMIRVLYNMSPPLWKNVRKSNFPIYKIFPDLEKMVVDGNYDSKLLLKLTYLAAISLCIQMVSRYVFKIT